MEARLAAMLDEIDGLYAVVESGDEELPDEWPESDYYVVFERTAGGQEAGVRIHVAEGDIVLLWQGCLAPVEELIADSSGSPLPIVIGPFESGI